MGNCGSSVNCTAVNQPVEANPDVAGIGVMVSFVATAIITFIAIVVGYLSDSLPDTSLSQLDRACIAKFSTIRWRPWVKDRSISLLLRRALTVAMGVLGWDYAVADHDEGPEDDAKSRDAREHRRKGLEKFILALSDQQLVTGLAVLIAGYISPCSMSIYHFNIIAALGWFSSTTHLSTLAVLRVYFIEHPRLRDWRVVAMLFVLGLLIIAQVGTGASTHNNCLPISCVFTHDSSSSDPAPSSASMTLVIIFLGVTYTNRIVRLYSLDPEWSLQGWLMDGIVLTLKKRTRLSRLTEIAVVCSKLPQVEQDNIRRKLKERQQYVGQELVEIVIKSSNKAKAEQGALWQSSKERRRYIRNHESLESRRRSGMLRQLLIFQIMANDINFSFLGDLFTLEFGVALGITQVIVSRVDEPSAGIVGSQNGVNFGQLVPLLLMLLPLFAAGEVYFERREDIMTKPSPNLTHKKPFFSRKIGLADIIRLYDGTSLSPDKTQHVVDVSSLLQSPESVSRGVGGSTWIELPSSPTSRLRRPDTETGQRAPMTGHSESTRTPPRNPEPEYETQQAKSPKKPLTSWRIFSFLVANIIIVQTVFAVVLGGAPVASTFRAVVILLFFTAALGILLVGIIGRLRESRNTWRG